MRLLAGSLCMSGLHQQQHGSKWLLMLCAGVTGGLLSGQLPAHIHHTYLTLWFSSLTACWCLANSNVASAAYSRGYSGGCRVVVALKPATASWLCVSCKQATFPASSEVPCKTLLVVLQQRRFASRAIPASCGMPACRGSTCCWLTLWLLSPTAVTRTLWLRHQLPLPLSITAIIYMFCCTHAGTSLPAYAYFVTYDHWSNLGCCFVRTLQCSTYHVKYLFNTYSFT